MIEVDFYNLYNLRFIFQYLETKNKLFLPLFFVYDHLLNHFKNEKLLSFSEINADKWKEFLHKLKEKYNEDQVIQKIDSDFEFQEEKKTYFFDYRKFFSRPEQNLQSFLTSRCLFFS